MRFPIGLVLMLFNTEPTHQSTGPDPLPLNAFHERDGIVPPQQYIYYNHIPKVRLHRPPIELSTTLGKDQKCETRIKGVRSASDSHCWHWHNSNLRQYLENRTFSTFCAIRDPLERFLSSYNYRRTMAFALTEKQGYTCSAEDISDYFHNVYIAGKDGDNHEIPQSDFLCDYRLCYDDLQSDFTRFLGQRGCAAPEVDSTFLPMNNVIFKPQWGGTEEIERCVLRNISCATTLAVSAAYKIDINLHKRSCLEYFHANPQKIRDYTAQCLQ